MKTCPGKALLFLRGCLKHTAGLNSANIRGFDVHPGTAPCAGCYMHGEKH